MADISRPTAARPAPRQAVSVEQLRETLRAARVGSCPVTVDGNTRLHPHACDRCTLFMEGVDAVLDELDRVGVATEAGITCGSDFVVTPNRSSGDVPLYRLHSRP